MQMDSDIGAFAIIPGALSRTICMGADGEASLAVLHGKNSSLTPPPLL